MVCIAAVLPRHIQRTTWHRTTGILLRAHAWKYFPQNTFGKPWRIVFQFQLSNLKWHLRYTQDVVPDPSSDSWTQTFNYQSQAVIGVNSSPSDWLHSSRRWNSDSSFSEMYQNNVTVHGHYRKTKHDNHRQTGLSFLHDWPCVLNKLTINEGHVIFAHMRMIILVAKDFVL